MATSNSKTAEVPGAEISRSKDLPWFHSTIGSSLTPAGRELLEHYSGVPPDEIEKHVYKIASPTYSPVIFCRDAAWEIFPWPCIGEFFFITLSLSQHPYYPTLLTRLTTPCVTLPRLLDLGTCLGQDLRKLYYDGAPLPALYGSDIFPSYEAAGHDLFLDKNRFVPGSGHFITADILDTFPENALVKTEGMWDIITITMFLHIWDYPTQVAACKRILKLLRPSKGSLVLGSQTETLQAGEQVLKPPFCKEGEKKSVFRHSKESFGEMWKRVGEEAEVGVKVWVDYMAVDGREDREIKDYEGRKEKFFGAGVDQRRLAFRIEVV